MANNLWHIAKDLDDYTLVVWKYNVKDGILIGSDVMNAGHGDRVILNKDSHWKYTKITGQVLKLKHSHFKYVLVELEQVVHSQHPSDDCLDALKGYVYDVPDDISVHGISVQETKIADCQQDIYWTLVINGGNVKQLDGAVVNWTTAYV